MMNDEHVVNRNSGGKRSALLGACMMTLILVMIVLTCLFLPRAYGEILSCNEVYPASEPYTFVVELGVDEQWHVKSWTETEGTSYNVTLTGHPILSIDSEHVIIEETCFTYKWTLSLDSPETYNSTEFDLKMPSSSQNRWVFDVLIEGYGGIHITISKFDRHFFNMFFIPDLICTLASLVILGLMIRKRKPPKTAEYENDLYLDTSTLSVANNLTCGSIDLYNSLCTCL